MCSETLQEHSQVLLKAPAVMEVHLDAMRFDLQNCQILERLRPLRRSAGDFKSSWDRYAALQETLRALRET